MAQDIVDPIVSNAVFRKLWPGDFGQFRDHLKRLDPESRRLRFGGAVSDAFIDQYSETAYRLQGLIQGCFIDGVLRASAELRPIFDTWPIEAEAAFAVEREYQESGIGTELMRRLITAARNRGIKTLYMICLRENSRMRRLAEKYKADLRFEESEIAGTLDPPFPTYLSVMEELVGDASGFVTAILQWRH